MCIRDSFETTLTAAQGYKLPATVTVTGATGTFDPATGKLTISNITGDVTVTAEAVEEDVPVVGEYDVTGTVTVFRKSYDIELGKKTGTTCNVTDEEIIDALIAVRSSFASVRDNLVVTKVENNATTGNVQRGADGVSWDITDYDATAGLAITMSGTGLSLIHI